MCLTQATKQGKKEKSSAGRWPEPTAAALAHRVQGLQRRRPLDARAGLWPASGARGG